MRCTELTLIPIALAMAAPSNGLLPAAVGTGQGDDPFGDLWVSGGMRDGRVLSRQPRRRRPRMKRSCQRQITVLLLPVRCMIAAVPRPSPVSSTIFGRQTCFCGLLRLATTASRRVRSAALNRIFVRSCILQTRTRKSAGEPQPIAKCQIWSTRTRTLAGIGSVSIPPSPLTRCG